MIRLSYLSPKTEVRESTPDCRKILTGKGWQRTDLQNRYASYFSTYVARKIALLDIRC